jgi:adhesin transport system membrane fusion protein
VTLPRARAAIDEAQQRLDIAHSVFRTEVLERLAKARSELAVVLETERDLADRVARTQLRAPTRGVINKLSVSTVGAVVHPGQDLVSIVPIDDSLEIEARIRPRDVAFIREGQKASVKLTAYDYTIYGALSGEVRRISADTITDSQGEAFYRAIVSTYQAYLDYKGKQLPIMPGMQASVDIQTGEKTVMEYIMKPVSKLRSEALREN